MILSFNRQFAFVHVHKCAGTSIEVALAAHLAPNDLVLGSTPGGERLQSVFKQVIGLDKHATAAQARQWLGPQRWARWYTFAFVRHPLERLRSLYTFARGLAEAQPMDEAERRAWEDEARWPNRLPYHYAAVRAAVQSETFDAFLCHPLTWRDAGAQPMWRCLCDERQQLLVDFVGRVETAEDDWAQVQQRLALDAPLGMHNRSRHNTEVELSDAAWAQVRAHCLTDFQRFGYPVPAALSGEPWPAPPPENDDAAG